MFNLLLALITGLIIGWNFHSFFIQLNPVKILQHEMNISKVLKEEKITNGINTVSVDEKVIVKPVIELKEKVPLQNNTVVDSFDILLRKDLFSDAMALYLDAENKKLPIYRAILISYFKVKSTIAPQETVTQMLEFKELEPKHKVTSLQLIKTYKSLKEYVKAIEIITELLDDASASELELLYVNLLSTSQSYIDELYNIQNFQNLVSFLKERIELGTKVPFYIYSLAEYYVEIQNYDPAIQLLKEIEYDYNYGEKAKILLELIEKKIIKAQEYQHHIVLKKIGEHFALDVKVDNLPLTLLLDTGATLTMVNQEKLNSLTLIKENIILNTAGGQISAQLQEADSFIVADIELEKFQIVSSTFEQKEADGLLGMNFFKKFRFKIDQEKEILYLSKK